MGTSCPGLESKEGSYREGLQTQPARLDLDRRLGDHSQDTDHLQSQGDEASPNMATNLFANEATFLLQIKHFSYLRLQCGCLFQLWKIRRVPLHGLFLRVQVHVCAYLCMCVEAKRELQLSLP